MTPRCVVHIEGLKYGPLQLFINKKDGEKTLQKLKEVRSLRQCQPVGSKYRMHEACDRIPESYTDYDGFHRECYQRFTMNLNRLETPPEMPEPACSSRSSRRSSNDSDTVIFKPDCIFCNSVGCKKIKVKGNWTTEGTSQFEFGGWKRVLEAAEEKADETLLTRIRGHDLFAREARFHKSCRAKYVSDPKHLRSTDDENRAQQQKLELAHRETYLKVCQKIDRDIICDKKIVKLSELRQLYISGLADTEFPNPNYRSENLKAKLEKDVTYCGKLSFCKLGNQFTSCIVYSSDIDVNCAVKSAYELGSIDMIQDAAMYLHQLIMRHFEESEELKWPPTPKDLENSDGIIPPQLEKFLSYVITGKPTAVTSRAHRLVHSIGQDICRAATNGEWKLPKHLLICMTMRHLFRSEQLVTLLNRMGHSESYSFSLELETAIAQAVEKTSSFLSTQIVRDPDAPSVFHSEFDNFDQLLNDLTGMGSIHTAHGIMLQEIEGNPEQHGGTRPETPSTSRSRQRSLKTDQAGSLPECYVTHRKSPSLTVNQLVCPGAEEAVVLAMKRNFTWVLLRMKSKEPHQDIPGWTGFTSLTGVEPASLTTIDYYPVITHAITDYKTVQECLRYAEEATREVNQEYVVTTFDLGVCMKAYPLIWNQPERYEKHIVLIGTFHLICAYLKMVGKKMEGSGLSDILLEAGLIASGSLQGVLSGKHYDRAMHCHKILLECLERLLLEQYMAKQEEQELFSSLPAESVKKVEDVVESTTATTLEAALADDAISNYIEGYIQYRTEVTEGSHGKTGQLWASYMNHVWLVLTLVQAVKRNDFLAYAHCLHVMGDLFFAFGGQNYARYLTYFSTFLANIEESHPGATDLIKRGAMSVARSFIPGNRCAVDKTMEETFMRHAKSHGGAGGGGIGVSGILSNHDTYQRWVRTTHARSQYVNATLNMADMLTDNQSGNIHRDARPAEILKSEKCVKKAQEAVESFINPFMVEDHDKLISLSSGAAAIADIASDVLRAEAAGKEAKEAFIRDRLEKNDNFFEPINRLNLKTLGNMNKQLKVTTANNKVVQYKQQGNIAFQLFVKSQSQGLQLDLKELMTYPLTPVPFSIGTADGFLAKTDKSKSFQYLTKECEDSPVPAPESTLVVYDGNAYFYYLKEIPANFGQICGKIFGMMSTTADAVFSTDMYSPNSVKSMERERRGCSEKLIIKGPSTKKPPDWKLFLTNDENKTQFISLLCTVWSSPANASKLQGRSVILICEGTAYQLTSEDGETTEKKEIETLRSTQEETDSRVVLYCMYGKDKGYQYIRIKSPDSDVFFILLHYALTLKDVVILFDTGTGNKQRLINITELAEGYTQNHCTALMCLHAYTRCDTTSAFKGVGKVRPLKALQKTPKFAAVLSRLGEEWNITEDLINDLEDFTCAIYGRARVHKVDELRHIRIQELCAQEDQLHPSKNVDLGSLPPCRRSLEQHIRRVNYQVGIWKRSHIPEPDVPDVKSGHGWVLKDDKLEPLWYTGDVLPQQLIDIADDAVEPDSDDSDADCLD